MASTTKHRFTDEFKREAVALWETSGRMRTEVAAELGIMPTMLHRWQRKLGDGWPRSHLSFGSRYAAGACVDRLAATGATPQ